jgi:hypothetical protein
MAQMRNRALGTALCGLLMAALIAAVAFAGGSAPVFAIPGVSGKRVSVGGVSRLSDGGGLVAGALDPRATKPAWRPFVARLQLDGSVDLAYGTRGVTTLVVAPDSRVTSLATDPATGSGWIGVAAGPHARSEIIALDGSGHRRTRFGRRGTITLPASANGGPAAIAWHRGELLVAAGAKSCAGCALSLLDPATGHVLHTAVLDPAYSPGCTATAVTSAGFLSAAHAVLGVRDHGPRTCSGALVRLNGSSPLKPVWRTLPGAARSTLVSAAPGGACVAESGPTGTALGPLGARGLARAPAGRLIGVSPLGNGACAALVAARGQPAALVLQAAAGARRATSDAIPVHVHPLGIFRCHQHLLVIGDRRGVSGRDAVVVVIPVRTGPNSLAADLSSGGTTEPSTCR